MTCEMCEVSFETDTNAILCDACTAYTLEYIHPNEVK